MNNVLRSVLAVLAGFIVIVILSVGTDYVLETTDIFPSLQEQMASGFNVWWMLLVALVYRCIYAVLGCYITASLAPNKPMRHALILGFIGLIVTILGSIAMWDQSAAWYPISLIVLTLPCAWLGGWLKTRRNTNNSRY